MKKNQIFIGKIFGIPIGLDYSWFMIFVLITWVLAVSYFPSEFKGWTQVQYWIVSLFTAVIFFFSVILHELGHSLTALKYNIKVKQITLFIFGGISDIAQEPPKASAEFWIAIAGPIVSFLLAGIFEAIAVIFHSNQQVFGLFKYLALINFVLALFNLVPGFPLDGGRVLRAIVWAITKNINKATSAAATVGRFFGFFFILVGVFEIVTGDMLDGMWIAFIGWFLESAASSQVQQMQMHDLLKIHNVSEAVSFDFGIVSKGINLQEVLDNHFLGIGRRCLLVKDESSEKYVGLLTLHQIKKIPNEKRAGTDVTIAMIPINETVTADENDNLWDTVTKMDKDGVNQIPVFSNGKITGILSRDSLISFLKYLKENGIH